MIDTDKLKRLAEEARETAETAEQVVKNRAYIIATTPSAVLDLIADNERLMEENHIRFEQALVNGSDAATYKHQRDEAVSLLRECIGLDFEGTEIEQRILGFLARIDDKGSE